MSVQEQGTGAARGIVEIIVGSGMTGLVELNDRSALMALPGKNATQVSRDIGASWDEPKPAICDGQTMSQGITGVMRLQSGQLAMTYATSESMYMAASDDDGETWSTVGEIGRNADGTPYHDVMIQLKSGRLLMPVRWCGGAEHPDITNPQAVGQWKGHEIALEGHGHVPEIDIAFVYYSDDQGKTWQRCKGYLMGWFNGGNSGVTPCDEPCVAETKDGRVLFFARSTVGRIVSSYSDDGGVTWSTVTPTELANSYSPARLVTIPQTGDLLCVWNQVSADEIRCGYRRGRLSVAISENSGETWKNFKTLEVSEGIGPDVTRVQLEPDVPMVRANDDCGEMPDGWSFFHYANADFVGDHVFITYLHGRLIEDDGSGVRKVGQPQQQRLRVYPVSWLYEESG